MKLSDVINPRRIFLEIEAADKPSFLRIAADIIADTESVCECGSVLKKLGDREAVMSTGIGNQVAVAEIVVPECCTSDIFLFRLKRAIDFDALDNQPVRIIFIVVGNSQIFDIAKILAKIDRMLRKPTFIPALLAAPDIRAILEAIRDHD